MIVGIASVRNEASIIRTTVEHTLGAGADHLIISDGHSTDGTKDILESLDGVTVLDQDGLFDQPSETMRLVYEAKVLGADWVVPFDADEFWVDLAPLNELEAGCVKVDATVFGHTTWDLRHRDPRRLPKVAFRDAVLCEWGNHDAVVGPGGTAGGFGIRELQYQSFAHFLAKIEKSRELFESYTFSEGHGSHMRALVAMSDEERQAEWVRLNTIPTVYDPIPLQKPR